MALLFPNLLKFLFLYSWISSQPNVNIFKYFEAFVLVLMDFKPNQCDLTILQNNKISDNTSAAQARRGKDIQGIPWDRLSITREKYRQTRLEQYKNYENIPHSGQGSEKVKVIISCPLSFYDNSCIQYFSSNWTKLKFQFVYRIAKLPRRVPRIMTSD